MNTLTQNTVYDTPSFAENTQLESTGIRVLTLDEIELINGACSASGALLHFAAGAATGVIFTKHPVGALIVGGVFAGVYYYENCYGA